jgi:hypothetical protein
MKGVYCQLFNIKISELRREVRGMFFLEISEWVLAILVFLCAVTQILIPLARGTAYFPAFRKKRAKLEEKLVEAKEEVEETKLKLEIEKALKKGKTMR